MAKVTRRKPQGGGLHPALWGLPFPRLLLWGEMGTGLWGGWVLLSPPHWLQGQMALKVAPLLPAVRVLAAPWGGENHGNANPSVTLLTRSVPTVLMIALFWCGPQRMHCSCNMVSPERESWVNEKTSSRACRGRFWSQDAVGAPSSPAGPGVQSCGCRLIEVDVLTLPLPGGSGLHWNSDCSQDWNLCLSLEAPAGRTRPMPGR